MLNMSYQFSSYNISLIKLLLSVLKTGGPYDNNTNTRETDRWTVMLPDGMSEVCGETKELGRLGGGMRKLHL